MQEERSGSLSLLDTLYIFSGVALILFLILVLVFSVISPNSISDNSVSKIRFFELLMWLITAFIAAWTTFGRSSFIVPISAIALIDNKIRWPGTEISLYPWLNYDVTVGSDLVYVNEDIRVDCRDGALSAEVRAVVQINIDEARERGVTSIDFNALRDEVSKNVPAYFTEGAKEKTVRELLTGKSSAKNFDAAGIPVFWNGKLEITAVVK